MSLRLNDIAPSSTAETTEGNIKDMEVINPGRELNEVPKDVRHAALALWDNDVDAARRFLERPHPLLDGRTPAAVARESGPGAHRVALLIGQIDAGVAI